MADSNIKASHDGHDHENEHEWGFCKACQWWQLEPGARAGDRTLGHCIHEELEPYNLRVSGLSGCNHFMHGKPARAAGSSEAPPRVEAAH